MSSQNDGKCPKALKRAKIEIKHWSGSVLYTSKKTTLKEVLIEAKECGANLIGANLRDANLIGANLSNADLMNCKFYGKGGKIKLYSIEGVLLMEIDSGNSINRCNFSYNDDLIICEDDKNYVRTYDNIVNIIYPPK